MKRILVTGGGGFIGRQIVPLLVQAGHEVHAAGRRKVEAEGVTSHLLDLLTAQDVSAMIARVRPTHLMHLAWYVEHGKFWSSTENLRWVPASTHLLQEFVSHGGQRCVSAGTCAEYDWAYDLCSETNTPCRPHTLYGACKHGLEQIQTVFCRSVGVSSAWGRIFHLYGPFESPCRLVPFVVTSLLRGEAAPCTSGQQLRDFLHVKDVARAFIGLLESDLEGPVNIGSGIAATLRALIDLIGTITGRSDLIRFGEVPIPDKGPLRLLPDVDRLQSTGFRPQYTLEAGLAETINWWRARVPGSAAMSHLCSL